jgi:hypothetical protein
MVMIEMWKNVLLREVFPKKWRTYSKVEILTYRLSFCMFLLSVRFVFYLTMLLAGIDWMIYFICCVIYEIFRSSDCMMSNGRMINE